MSNEHSNNNKRRIIPETIPLATEDETLHPEAERMEEEIKADTPSPGGYCRTDGNDKSFRIIVSQQTRSKAIRFLHPLICTLEEFGIETGNIEKHKRYGFSKQGALAWIEIEEQYDKKIPDLTKSYNLTYSGNPRYEHILNGRLKFRLDSEEGFPGQRSWNETATQPIEWILARVIENIIQSFDKLIPWEREREAQKRRWAEEAKEEERRRLAYKLEEEHKRTLLQAVELDRRSQAVADFVAKCERRWRDSQSQALTPEQEKWLLWASKRATRLSPFTYGYPKPEKDFPIDLEEWDKNTPLPEPTRLPS
ncbi:hypothetical protein [Pelagicoccus mobilis]|uniref:Uncharacterized protein n=1 Tax=Pelagicoccus mobilis TaxID=415221 RepID=A0A934RZ52_9BACT|nr:hypothetical protein [Pelagicoccus mobilis]MBK1877964.1 hypothetical protein [Pelagicoccus mobilis]